MHDSVGVAGGGRSASDERGAVAGVSCDLSVGFSSPTRRPGVERK